jgi:hypothetical protein
LKATVKGFFPTSSTLTQATVSGTLMSFNDYQVQLGSTLIAASTATKAQITDLSVTVNNNAEVVYESGQSTPTRIFWKQLNVTGSFTRFFETPVDRDNYLNLNKQSMIVTFSGSALPGGNVESITFNFAKLAYTDAVISTGIETFFAVKTSFEAEVDPSQGKQYDIVLRNYRSTVY